MFLQTANNAQPASIFNMFHTFAMIETSSNAVLERQEDFPVEVFLYLEERLHEIRKHVMEVAAKRADDRQRGTEIYTVIKQDIDAAIEEVLSKKIEGL
jgi:hypothetical protein